MIGGLLKSSSKLALMAAAGILVGGVSMGSAKAADLGGDCCADLEERVAELEATTVRKGNRKVSLTLSGQINRGIMYMNDGIRSRTIAGVDNTISSSRFTFTGDAKITSSVKAGFEMMVEWSGSSRTQEVNTLSTTAHNWPGFLSNASSSLANVNGNIPTPFLANGSGDGSLAIRTANWYLEDKVLGRVTVGRVNIQGPASTIDISGGDVGLVGSSNPVLTSGGLFLSQSGGTTYFPLQIGTPSAGIAPWCYGCSREEGIRWDSASIYGFTFGAFWGEQDVFTAQFRYAAEFGGFQIAAGGGYQHSNNLGGLDNSYNVVFPQRVDVEQQAYALSVKHVASGLFAQGNVGRTDWKFNNPGAFTGANVNATKNPGTMWYLQGGIAKNWFGPGVTALYGEYGHGQGYLSSTNGGISGTSFASAGTSYTAGNVAGSGNNAFFSVPGGVSGFVAKDSIDFYGLGVTQKIDAAAMTLYLGWRHYDPKISVNPATAVSNTPTKIDLNGIDQVFGGARIMF